MKNNLFFVASDYKLARKLATSVAEFFSMRLFDSVEMFEFDNAPRKIEEVILDFGEDYVMKEMRSIAKMQLDFDESVFVGDLKYAKNWLDLFPKIQNHNLVFFLNQKNIINENEENKKLKLNFLSDCCDVAINIDKLSDEQIFEKVIDEIKSYFSLEV